MADGDSWDADTFEPDAPIKNAAAASNDKWEGEDEEDDVKDNWDDEEEDAEDEEEKSGEKPAEVKPPAEKKKLSDKIKERESLQRRRQEELRKRMEEGNESTDVTPDEEPMKVLPLQMRLEEAHRELADDSTDITVVSNHVAGIDEMSPSSLSDFTEFEKLLKEKITPYEKSVHYCPFLESLFRNVCLSLEVEDLKKVNNSLTVLLSEKQRLDKSKAKKKKKGVVPAGGMKAKMKDDLVGDYSEFDGGYAQDYEDFM